VTTELWAVGLVLIGCVVGAFGPIFLKRASDSISLNILKLIKNWNLIIGVACYGFGTIVFIPALKGGDLSVLYPLVAVSYVLVCLYSIKMLKEKMNTLKWIGIALIMVGVMFIGLGSI
jgi:uncharacterized membrane protein